MERFGPVANLHDGGGKGEKFFPQIKMHLPRGIRPKESSYFINLQKRVYKVHAMKVVMEEMLGEDSAREGVCPADALAIPC